MEKLLHFTWHNGLLPLVPLTTTSGAPITIINPGRPNRNAGPDFLQAQISINGTLWVGDVELHERSSDWYRHGHDKNSAYNAVVLHVASTIDKEVYTAQGTRLPQLALQPHPLVIQSYDYLLQKEGFPRCYHVFKDLLITDKVYTWLPTLTRKRLSYKADRILSYLAKSGGDWEQTTFVALARNFGFGLNGEAFEDWAWRIQPSQIGKHRDNLFQIEAFFLGQAGLLTYDRLPQRLQSAAAEDTYFTALAHEYSFLQHKFSLAPMDTALWKFLRLRPQNFPFIRLAQLAQLYHQGTATFSQLTQATHLDDLCKMLQTSASNYWENHFGFGIISEGAVGTKSLQRSTLELLVINTVVPLLYAHGMVREQPAECDRAIAFLREIKPEKNHIMRAWDQLGIKPQHAADSQALIHLRTQYCDTKDCLRCPAGLDYLKQACAPATLLHTKSLETNHTHISPLS